MTINKEFIERIRDPFLNPVSQNCHMKGSGLWLSINSNMSFFTEFGMTLQSHYVQSKGDHFVAYLWPILFPLEMFDAV